ncbi:MAG: nitrilase-related carbon-nitrogen hydrolase, partial [Planctomycetota bacterium]
NICYETVIPHVIHGQVRRLTREGTRPDLLVNVTNNAWFWGSSELEMHLACNIFRAVENRTPMVIAANGGLSAAIDSCGRVLQVSDRMTEQVLITDVPLDPRASFYTRRGDVFAGACLAACVLLSLRRWLGRRQQISPDTPVKA